MNEKLKKRLTGAVVLVGAVLLFFVMIIDDPEGDGSELTAGGEIETRVFTVEIGESTRVAAETRPETAAVSKPAAAATADAQKKSVEAPAVVKKAPAAAQPPASKPAPKPKPAAVKPAPATPGPEESGGPWDVQVGSYSSQDSARSVRDRLKKAGHNAFIMAVKINGKPWWRVRVGPLKSRARADALAAEISREFRVSARVMIAG